MYLIHSILMFLALSYALFTMQWVKQLRVKRAIIWGIFTIKSIFGISTLYIYGYFTSAGADVYNYFYTAELVNLYAKANPVAYYEYFQVFGWTHTPLQTPFEGLSLHAFPSVWGIVGFNTALHAISYGNPLVVALIYNFISTLGILRLVRALSAKNKWLNWYNLLVLVGLPTMVFWSSIVLKDGLVYTFLAVALAEVIEYKTQYIKRALFYTALLAVLVVKIQMIPFIVPVVLFLVLSDFTRLKPVVALFTTFGILIVGAIISSYQPYEALNILHRFQAILAKHYEMIEQHQQTINTTFVIYSYNSIWEYFSLLPRGLWNTLSEPFITNRNIFYTYVALENRVLFAAVAVKIIYITSRIDALSRTNALLIVISVVFLSVSGTLIPIGGALFRYRVVVLGFLLAVSSSGVIGSKKAC